MKFAIMARNHISRKNNQSLLIRLIQGLSKINT
jgi:hypothetical protein